ncbi:hypothetical protein LTR17_010556 [Elasticomyces elasticus]|nr:hypothetical protein LTR17_010556 [Elasticomyces elasticus]
MEMMKDNAREDGNGAGNDQSSERRERLEAGMTRAGVGKARGRCYILELPKELRLQIYELLSLDCIQLRTYDEPTIVGLSAQEVATQRLHCIRDSSDLNLHMNILYTNRQVCGEARAILQRPQHVVFQISASYKWTSHERGVVEKLYTSLPDIRVLQSLTVSLVTMETTAAEDLAQSQVVIQTLLPGLKVQNFVIDLGDYLPDGNAEALWKNELTSLQALVTVWLQARIGSNTTIRIKGCGYKEVSWQSLGGGEWHQEGLDSALTEDSNVIFCSRISDAIKAASAPAIAP